MFSPWKTAPGPDVPGGATASKRHLLAFLQGVVTPRLPLGGPAGAPGSKKKSWWSSHFIFTFFLPIFF
jgi:hypothetical protein